MVTGAIVGVGGAIRKLLGGRKEGRGPRIELQENQRTKDRMSSQQVGWDTAWSLGHCILAAQETVWWPR